MSSRSQQSLPSYAVREEAILAPYAVHSIDSAGRVHPEDRHPYRGPFQRDRDRIVHCSAFRRLSHKTQVFTGNLGDYHRTRLTHTLEVASISRTLARGLRLNEDLVEALALLHDVGHPPFGHAGEDVLDECLAEEGGFNHNEHALRIVETLERRYPGFAGLNLSFEVLNSQRFRVAKSQSTKRSEISATGGKSPSQTMLPSVQQPCLEAQIVEAADSVAYDTHDVDDAIELQLLMVEELDEQPMWKAAARRVRNRFSSLTDEEYRRAVIHELLDWQVSDLLTATLVRLRENEIESVEEVLQTQGLVALPAELNELKQQFEEYLFRHVYRHPSVLAVRDRATSQLEEMFAGLLEEKLPFPSDWQHAVKATPRRAVADYLASMTDRHAEQEYRLLGHS